MPRCPACRTIVADNVSSCWRCHAPLDTKAEGEPAAAPERRPRRWGPAVALAVVVALVAAGSGIAWYATRPSKNAITYPAHWDGRVTSLVSFVEKERGLKFDHPVRVDFVPEAKFKKLVTKDAKKTNAKDRLKYERDAGFLRALGLVSGKIDLLAVENKISADSVLAFYDDDTKRVTVRGGTDMGAMARTVVVHELTHALQDQHFDLDRLDQLRTEGEKLGLRTMAEGDATHIEDLYAERLTDAEQAEYAKTEKPFLEQAKQADLPPYLGLIGGIPYDLGPFLIDVLKAKGGRDAVNGAFANPPVSSKQLLDPLAFVESEHPVTVATPKLGPGEKKIATNQVGAIDWYLLLVARVDATLALSSADGWAGDATMYFERNGVQCVRTTFQGRAQLDTDRMTGALQQWATAMPPQAGVTMEPSGNTVTLTSCDPGVDVPIALGTPDEALALPIVRAVLIAVLAEDNLPIGMATCIADSVVKHHSVAEVSDPEALFDREDVQIELAEDEAQCRAFYSAAPAEPYQGPAGEPIRGTKSSGH